MVATAGFAATLTGLAAAIFVTRPAGRDFRTTANLLATIGQTFPPAAVLALAVPALGFGARPTIVALFLYGLLPILENAIAGLEGVPAALREAARGMGLTRWQMLRDVELPLAAAPVILAGVRSVGDDRHRHRDDRARQSARLPSARRFLTGSPATSCLTCCRARCWWRCLRFSPICCSRCWRAGWRFLAREKGA